MTDILVGEQCTLVNKALQINVSLQSFTRYMSRDETRGISIKGCSVALGVIFMYKRLKFSCTYILL